MSPTPLPAQAIHPPPITVVLTVVLLIFFLLGFFSIYFCRCIVDSVFHTWNLRRGPSGPLAAGGISGVNPSHTGLDPALVKALPTFLYSTVTDATREKYALECAICLVEFSGESFLRLLTVCYHVFHQDCIDLWLASHKTCPVCRRSLDSAGKSPPPPPEEEDEAVRIEVSDGEGPDDRRRVLPRSHSMKEERDRDRYTLRVPQHVRMQIMRARNGTASCEAYGAEWDRHVAGLRYYASGTDESDNGALGADHRV